MDPDAAYEALVNAITSDDVNDIEIAWEALDTWIKDGGFLPSAWRH